MKTFKQNAADTALAIPAWLQAQQVKAAKKAAKTQRNNKALKRTLWSNAE